MVARRSLRGHVRSQRPLYILIRSTHVSSSWDVNLTVGNLLGGVLLGTIVFLLFPDGRLPSGRWRPLAWLSGVVIVPLCIFFGLSPGPLQNLGGTRNPFGLESYPWVETVGYFVLPLLPLCMIASVLSLVMRYRRSRGEERQQIKWIAFAASFVGLMYLIAMVCGFIFPSAAWREPRRSSAS